MAAGLGKHRKRRVDEDMGHALVVVPWRKLCAPPANDNESRRGMEYQMALAIPRTHLFFAILSEQFVSFVLKILRCCERSEKF